MKVCLIRPPIVLSTSNIMTTYTPPIGLAYVAGSLREVGFDLRFIDAVRGLGVLIFRNVYAEGC
jgi:hypothetical protein